MLPTWVPGTTNDSVQFAPRLPVSQYSKFGGSLSGLQRDESTYVAFTPGSDVRNVVQWVARTAFVLHPQRALGLNLISGSQACVGVSTKPHILKFLTVPTATAAP